MNKILAVFLVAGITAGLSGFVAKAAIYPEPLEENAVKIEMAEPVSADAPAKPAGPEPILGLLATADLERGKKVSKACLACHNFDKGGPNATGPNLWGLINRPKARHEGFEYSDAMKSQTGNWTYAELNHYLWKPKEVVPGTKMNFVGLKKTEDRAALIAWLRTLSDNPAPLPSDAEIAADSGSEPEEAEEAPEAEEPVEQ